MQINGFYPISLVSLCVLARALSLSPGATLLLLGVIWANVAIHELGHVLATRCTGGRVLGVSVLPWHGETNVLQEESLALAFVAMAGPATGILAGSGALFVLGQVGGALGATSFGMALHAILWAGTFDNLLNLIPCWVLDGSFFVSSIKSWRTERRLHEHREQRWQPEAVPAPAPARYWAVSASSPALASSNTGLP